MHVQSRSMVEKSTFQTIVLRITNRKLYKRSLSHANLRLRLFRLGNFDCMLFISNHRDRSH
jgi:hypothetical protein